MQIGWFWNFFFCKKKRKNNKASIRQCVDDFTSSQKIKKVGPRTWGEFYFDLIFTLGTLVELFSYSHSHVERVWLSNSRWSRRPVGGFDWQLTNMSIMCSWAPREVRPPGMVSWVKRWALWAWDSTERRKIRSFAWFMWIGREININITWIVDGY